MLRVMIVDDEPLARQGLRDLLAAHEDVVVLGESASVPEAAGQIFGLKPDAIFLDVRMPGVDGFDLLNRARPCAPVVFVTAYSEYAAQAFDVQAVDYLLKPVRPARLAQALQRLRTLNVPGQQGEASYAMADRICLRTPERTLIAPLGDVIALQAEKDFTRVTVENHPPILICQTIGVYERNLPSPPFLRLDRSTILNISRVHALEISPTRGAKVFLRGKEAPLPLGRAALRRLRQAMQKSSPDILPGKEGL